MREIKAREKIKGIKVLDKSVDLTTRMKGPFDRTRGLTEETHEPGSSSPSGYAIDNIQNNSQSVARGITHCLPSTGQKANESLRRAENHFQEVKRLLPKERRYTADQAQQMANKAEGSASSLRETAEKAQGKAYEARTAVTDARQTLKQVRFEGRQTLREVRQNVKCERSGKQPAGQRSIAHGRTATIKKPVISSADNANSIPTNYLSKGVDIPKGMGWTAKSSDESTKAAKSARAVKSKAKGFKDTAKGTVKDARKSVRTAEKSAKAAVKTAKQTAMTAQKTAQKTAKAAKAAEKTARAAARAAAQSAKAATKAVAAMVKAVVAAIRGLVAAIAAGGWIAMLIVLIVCMIALLVGSTFGIFFSSEPDPSTGQTVNGVITKINDEYTGEIKSITNSNAYDLLDMSGARASWKQVLAVYTVKTVSDPDNPMEVATMNDEKAAILRSVFWDMNSIIHSISTISIVEDVLGGDGLPTGETTSIAKTVLQITVSHKTVDEAALLYGFSDEQMQWLVELLKPDYHSLWNALLYGITTVGDGSMIEIADTQIGNIGGEPYWSWYGFTSRVEWCACFISWVAEQCGFIDAGIIPRFSLCEDGVRWFRSNGQWQDNGYIPAPGDIIFFDWDGDGISNHVGIVERIDDEYVYTIEGNTSDSCARRTYRMDSDKIMGYGVLKC